MPVLRPGDAHFGHGYARTSLWASATREVLPTYSYTQATHTRTTDGHARTTDGHTRTANGYAQTHTANAHAHPSPSAQTTDPRGSIGGCTKPDIHSRVLEQGSGGRELFR